MEREIIVVGAGPAGATAAMALTQKGHDVLLLDRQAFPRDKACGDAVSAGAIRILQQLGMGQKIKNAETEKLFYRIDSLRIISPSGRSFEANFSPSKAEASSYIAPRINFDTLLQNHAISSGAEFLLAQVKQPLLENNQVVGVRAIVSGVTKDIRAKLIIVADGATSTIARALRLKHHVNKHRAVALRAYIEDIEEIPHQIEFYLLKQILPGYGWIFPIDKGRANIGIGMRLDRYRQADLDLKDLFATFLQFPIIKSRLKQGGKVRDTKIWQLNFGSQNNLQHAFDGALLIGDAAGYINPLTGAGIENAIISAAIAADVADKALTKNDVSYHQLRSYEQICQDVMSESMRYSFLIQKWLLHPRMEVFLDFLLNRPSINSRLVQVFMEKL